MNDIPKEEKAFVSVWIPVSRRDYWSAEAEKRGIYRSDLISLAMEAYLNGRHIASPGGAHSALDELGEAVDG